MLIIYISVLHPGHGNVFRPNHSSVLNNNNYKYQLYGTILDSLRKGLSMLFLAPLLKLLPVGEEEEVVLALCLLNVPRRNRRCFGTF